MTNMAAQPAENTPPPAYFLYGFAGFAMLLTAAIFGFFYAWVCSTMWGLDAIDPRIAIDAMNGMNGSVRNAVFAPAFFGAPPALGITAILAARSGRRQAALWFALAALCTLAGAVLTFLYNVPMNEELMTITAPDDIEAARKIWTEYSAPWQVYNITRTIICGFGFVFGFIGVLQLKGR